MNGHSYLIVTLLSIVFYCGVKLKLIFALNIILESFSKVFKLISFFVVFIIPSTKFDWINGALVHVELAGIYSESFLSLDVVFFVGPV